jgi:hypothetical protein
MGFKKPVEERKTFKRWPEEYTTEETKAEIGDFEKEYDEACTGEKKQLGPLGFTFEGVFELASKVYQAVVRRERTTPYPNGEKYDYWVTRVGWPAWDHKYWGMHELKCRRQYAKRKELAQLKKEAEKIGQINEPKEAELLMNLGLDIPIEPEDPAEIEAQAEAKRQSDLEWEKKNGIKIEDIPF